MTIKRIDSAMTDVVVALTAGPEGVLAGEIVIPAGRERGVLELVADLDTEVGSFSFSLAAIADGVSPAFDPRVIEVQLTP